MAFIDIAIIAAYFLAVFAVALYFTKRVGKSTEEFFLSGRKLPWWVAGTAMVATTFAADTPLAVTELVATKGIAGNWLWWNMVAGNVLAVFFFARLWRRSGIMTDIEFIEMRYSGPEAAFLRGFKAVYLGVFLNAIIMGWVNVALAEILKNIFGIGAEQVVFYILGSMLVVGIYSSISGLWGVAYTDMFQFVLAMGGCIILALVVLDLPQIGGVAGLMDKLPADVFQFIPNVEMNGGMIAGGVLTLSFSAFAAHIAVQWWSSWYPGSEPGGGGYVAQRMMSARDERHSLLATLWFTIAHYALRPWPWIIVALCSMVLYPGLAPEAKKTGYVLAMRDHLPAGLLGLLVAAFLAAYMSTISTPELGHVLSVNDLYRAFYPQSERKVLRAGIADFHPGAHGRFEHVDFRDRQHLGSMVFHNRVRGRARARAHSQVVLVADQRLVRDIGHDRAFCRLCADKICTRNLFSRKPVFYCWPDHCGLDLGHVRDKARG